MVYDFDSEIHRISQEIDETTERDKMNIEMRLVREKFYILP